MGSLYTCTVCTPVQSVQYYTVLYSTVLYSKVQYCTVQYSTVHFLYSLYTSVEALYHIAAHCCSVKTKYYILARCCRGVVWNKTGNSFIRFVRARVWPRLVCRKRKQQRPCHQSRDTRGNVQVFTSKAII